MRSRELTDMVPTQTAGAIDAGICLELLLTWFIGVALVLLFIIVGLPALMFVFRCLFWVIGVWQWFAAGSPWPCFYQEECL